jgi:hypothetical protein
VVDSILFTKKKHDDNFICRVYVDDVIFGSTNEWHFKEFGEMVSKGFEFSMIGKLTFFQSFQIMQMREVKFVSKKSTPMTFSKDSRWINVSQSILQ